MKASKAASVGGLYNSSLTTALRAWRRIDFAAQSYWLHYYGIASAIACRTFRLSRFRGLVFHLNVSGRISWHPLSYFSSQTVSDHRACVTASRTKPTHVAYAARPSRAESMGPVCCFPFLP